MEHGDCGHAATEEPVRQNPMERAITGEIELVPVCIQNIASRSGERIPRPLLSVLHDQSPNGTLRIDLLFVGSSVDGQIKYVLVVRESLWGYNDTLGYGQATTHIVMQPQKP